MAFGGVLRQLLAGDVDVHRGVVSRGAVLLDLTEFPLVVSAEQDVVQPQLRMHSLDPPIKDDPGRGAFLLQDALGGLQVGEKLPVGGVQIGIAHHDVCAVHFAMSVLNTRHLSLVVKDALGWRFQPKRDAQGLGQSFEVKGDGSHATLGKKGADAVLEMGDDVHHGRRAVGVTAVVRGVPIEELGQFGMVEVPPVEAVEAAPQRQGPNPRQQTPRGGGFVGRCFMEAALQKDAPRQFEGISARAQVTQQSFCGNAPARFDVPCETFRIGPGHQRSVLVFPEVMGAAVEGFVLERPGTSRHIGIDQPVQFFHEFRHGEQGGAAVKPVPGVGVLAEFASDRLGGLEDCDAVPACGHSHGGGESTHAGADHDHVAGGCHARSRVETTSGKQILNQAV